MEKELIYENFEKKPIWLAYNKDGQEFMCVGENAPYFDGDKLLFNGELSVPLPRGSIRNLTKRVMETTEKPIRLSRKLMMNVGFSRDRKNAVISKLLADKYGKGNERAGFLVENGIIEQELKSTEEINK